jgi:hypothetical protein
VTMLKIGALADSSNESKGLLGRALLARWRACSQGLGPVHFIPTPPGREGGAPPGGRSTSIPSDTMEQGDVIPDQRLLPRRYAHCRTSTSLSPIFRRRGSRSASRLHRAPNGTLGGMGRRRLHADPHARFYQEGIRFPGKQALSDSAANRARDLNGLNMRNVALPKLQQKGDLLGQSRGDCALRGLRACRSSSRGHGPSRALSARSGRPARRHRAPLCAPENREDARTGCTKSSTGQRPTTGNTESRVPHAADHGRSARSDVNLRLHGHRRAGARVRGTLSFWRHALRRRIAVDDAPSSTRRSCGNSGFFRPLRRVLGTRWGTLLNPDTTPAPVSGSTTEWAWPRPYGPVPARALLARRSGARDRQRGR